MKIHKEWFSKYIIVKGLLLSIIPAIPTAVLILAFVCQLQNGWHWMMLILAPIAFVDFMCFYIIFNELRTNVNDAVYRDDPEYQQRRTLDILIRSQMPRRFF